MKIPKPKFILNFFRSPQRFEGGLILNLFGYHLLRIVRFQLSFTLRRKRILVEDKEKNTLQEVLDSGIAVLPNFFSEEVFLEIKKEVENLKLDVFNEKTPYIERSAFVTDEKPVRSRVLEKYLAQNDFINHVVSAILKKDILLVPTVQVEKSWVDQKDLCASSTDKADNLHFDVSYPTMKCFL